MTLRILHVTPYFEDAWGYGGIPRIASTLVRELAHRGHAVTVCTTDAADADGRTSYRPTGGGTSVRPGTGEVAPVDVRIFPNLSNKLAYHGQVFLPRGLGAFLAAHAGDFDVAHLHACRNVPVSMAARHLGRARVPYVMAPNGTAPRIERRQAAKWIYDVVMGRLDLEGASAVIAVSDAERRQLEHIGVPPDRIRMVANPVDLDEHSSPPSRGAFRREYQLGAGPVVLYLGKLTPRKRVDVLLRAVSGMAELKFGTTNTWSGSAEPKFGPTRTPGTGGEPALRLVIAGNDMGSRGSLERLTKELHLEDRVRFTGLLRGTHRLQALADADVLVYPSSDEVFGLVPLEALLTGTPVIVADDSGCGELIRQVGGGLVTPLGDADALANAIRTVLSDRDAWRTRALAAAALVRERFGGAAVAAELEALYHDVIAAH